VFDRQCLEFLNVDFRGSGLEGCSYIAEPDSQGVRVVFDTTVMAVSPRSLGKFLFRPLGNVSARCKVSFNLEGFRTPCRFFQDASGTVEIVPVLGLSNREERAFHFTAFPNPFGPGSWTGRDEMQIEFYAPRECRADLNLYDARGNMVKVLARGIFQPGSHHVRVDGSGLDSGVYFIVLEAGGKRKTMPVVFMR
ncbi:MAG: T9SS type A sorting domain-containing protein, partial [Chlorobi bacterium]|nr:T9SS type A sorting domain-containing protein [Chlorobiota bacterium]